jgi:hypothetical protein
MTHYNQDAGKAYTGEMDYNEHGEKYYHYYKRSGILNSDTAYILNKVFAHTRFNSTKKTSEVAGIHFYLNDKKQLVYKKSIYYSVHYIFGKGMILDKSKWTGYAILEEGMVKTENLYNYNWNLAHQLIDYSFTDSTLVMKKMYRLDSPSNSLSDTLVFRRIK